MPTLPTQDEDFEVILDFGEGGKRGGGEGCGGGRGLGSEVVWGSRMFWIEVGDLGLGAVLEDVGGA